VAACEVDHGVRMCATELRQVIRHAVPAQDGDRSSSHSCAAYAERAEEARLLHKHGGHPGVLQQRAECQRQRMLAPCGDYHGRAGDRQGVRNRLAQLRAAGRVAVRKELCRVHAAERARKQAAELGEHSQRSGAERNCR